MWQSRYFRLYSDCLVVRRILRFAADIVLQYYKSKRDSEGAGTIPIFAITVSAALFLLDLIILARRLRFLQSI